MDLFQFLNGFVKVICGIIGICISLGTFLLFKNFNFAQYKFLFFLDYKAMFLIFAFCVSILGLSIIACLLVIRANKVRQFGKQKDSWLKERFKVFLGLQKEKDCVEEYFNATNFMLKSFLKNTSSYKYELPWYITFGAINSGKSSFMNAVTLHRPLEMNIDNENYLNHYFFNNGVVIDVKTELIYNESTHDFSWEGLVNNLKKNRNEKSIDGVLYFISLKDLYEDAKSGKNELKKQSEILYSKLWYMQNKFEMKIPVYIIFTNLDYLDGFKEFSDIFQDYYNDIFGWSNPHSIDSQFDEVWLDEMFIQLNTSLKFIQSEMMVNFSDEVSFDMMNFINNFKDVQSKIFSFLKSTFKINKYATGLYFRGAYFTALDYSKSQSQQLPFLNKESLGYSQTIIESKKLYFGNDLLDKKIFLEKNIGKNEMDRRTLMNNLKKFKIFNLVFLIAATFYSYKVYNDCLYIEDSIQPKILKVIEIVNQSEYDSDFNQSKEFKDDLKLLLIYLEELARYDLSFYGVPSSWLCSVNRNKNKLFFKAYNKLIVENLVKEIVSRYQALARKRFVVSYDLDTGLISPLEMNEFKNFNSLIEDLSRLEMYEKNMKAILEYNSISKLKDLLFDIYNIEVPLYFAKKIMYANSSEEYEILRYKITLAKAAIKKKFKWCIDQFDLNCFSGDRIRKYFADLSRFLLLVDHNSNVLNIENIKSVQLSMTNLITFFNSSESEWLKLKHFALEQYIELLDKISASETLSVSEDFFKRIETSYSRFKKELSAYQLPIIGSPLYLSANRSIEITPSVLNIHGILNNIFSESFMIMPSCKILEETGKDEFIRWNSIELEEIANIIKDYTEFIEMKSSNKFEECVKKIARNNIIDVIEHKLCKARKVVIFKNDKSYLADLSNNIKKNSQYMFEILHFVKKNNSDFFIRLKNIEKNNLSNYLQSVNINLERDNLYQITKETLGLDINEQRLYYKMNLAEYLVAQKDLLEFYIRDLASDAIKSLEYIKHLESGKISMLVSKFKGLEISLDNYKLNPSSSELYKLEQFLGKVHSTSLSLLMTDLNKDSKILSANRYLENKLIITRKIINEFLHDSIINLVDNQYQVGKDFFKEYASTFPFSLNGELIGLKGYETMDYLSKKQRAVLDVIYIIDTKFKPRTVEFVDTLAKCSKLIHYIKTDEEYIVMKFKSYQSIGELYERNLKYLIDFSAKVSGQKPITLYWTGELKIYDTLEFDIELAKNNNIKFSGVKDKEGYTLVNNTTLKLKLNKKQLVRFLLENIKIINNQSFIRFTIGIEDDKGIRDKMVIMMPVDLTLDGLPFSIPQKSFRKLLGDVI